MCIVHFIFHIYDISYHSVIKVQIISRYTARVSRTSLLLIRLFEKLQINYNADVSDYHVYYRFITIRFRGKTAPCYISRRWRI